ncbi:MAG: DUF5684 domain-containing protein [Crocinitomicaceae bacterium]
MNVYLKNFGLWLGAPLLLIWLLPLLGIYLPFLSWIALIGGVIAGVVTTHKAIGGRINFGKAFGAIAIILGAFFILGLVRTVIEWGAGDLGFMLPFMLTAFVTELFFATYLLLFVGVWYMFEKAGKPGWGAIVPIYNIILMTEIAKKPTWWVAMFFIPIANIVFAIMLMDGIAKSFNKDTGFTVGLVLLGPIFMAVLGYGDSVYGDGNVEPATAESTDLLDN